MKRVKKIIAVAMMTIMTASLLAGCNLIERTPEGLAKATAAKIYGEKITRGEIDEKLAPVKNQMKAQNGENYENTEEGKNVLKQYRQKVLDNMVTQKIIEKKAEELKAMPTEEETKKYVDEEYKKIVDSFDSEDKFKEALKQTGETEESLKQNIKFQLVSEKLHEHVIKDIEVTDEEVKKQYDSNQMEYTEKPNQTQLKHILVQTEDEANDIIKKLGEGKDFDELGNEVKKAQEEKNANKSEDKKDEEKKDEAADKQGEEAKENRFEDLGWVNYINSGMDPTFMQFAMPLTKGGYTTAPVHTQFGYHIIKCYDKKEYPVKPLDGLKEQIKSELLTNKQNTAWQEAAQKWQEEAKKEMKVYEKNLQ